MPNGLIFEFTLEAGRYDVIWVQWCIGHLADDDFVSFFKRAKGGLKLGGFFVLKENIARAKIANVQISGQHVYENSLMIQMKSFMLVMKSMVVMIK
ncbi:hypothetical protein CsSME_00012002 [Camellia sinensis var. sinensis]